MKQHLLRLMVWLILASGAALASEKNSPAPTRIALISDLHVRGTNEEQRILHRNHLEQAMAAINAEKVDLVLVAGDLTEHGTPEEIREFKDQVKALQAPVWFVAGNHDIGNKILHGQQKQDSVNPWRVARFEMHWGSTYFVRELPTVRVIGLNSPICGTGFSREKRMWSFLEKKLAKPSEKPTLLLMHFPAFVKSPDEPGGVYWNLEPLPRQRLLSLVRQGGVKAVLSGHTHTESVSRHDDVLYVTTPPIAFGLPKGKQKEGWTLLTVSASGEVEAKVQYLEAGQ